MSDINSGLPIRTELAGQTNYSDVIIKVGDATNPATQQASVDTFGSLKSRIADATGAVVTSQTNGAQRALDVGINVAGVQIDPRQIRALTAADVVTANQGSANTIVNAWFVKPTDGTNSQSFTVAGEALVKINQLLLEDHNYGAVGANTFRSAAQLGNATGAADFNNGATGAQTLRVAANLAVAGSDVSNTNPIPVTIEASPGTHVNDFKDATVIAAGASDNHDYTVTAGKTLHLNQIEGTASGKAKMEIQIETGVSTGTFTSKFVQFNSTATPIMSIKLNNDISVAAGVRVRVIMTNRDNQTMDIYSTISGYEI
jgi:hypothetical protein